MFLWAQHLYPVWGNFLSRMTMFLLKYWDNTQGHCNFWTSNFNSKMCESNLVRLSQCIKYVQFRKFREVLRSASYECQVQKILCILCNIGLSLYNTTLLWNWIQFSELDTFNYRRVSSLKWITTAINRTDQSISWSFFDKQQDSLGSVHRSLCTDAL